MRSLVPRVAAMAVLVLTLTGDATPAQADFLDSIVKAKTVKYKMTLEIKGPTALTTTSEEMVLDATRSRREMEMPGKLRSVVITDLGQGKSLDLCPATKQATVLEYSNTENARNDPALWIRLLQIARDSKNKNVQREPLVEKEIAGRQVVGFRIRQDRCVMDLWGDPQNDLPILVEMTMGEGGDRKATFSDFVFNVDMDESLFSVEPPAGYTVRKEKIDNSPRDEKDLIALFRDYAKLAGGGFPRSLDPEMVMRMFWVKGNVQGLWDSLHMAHGNTVPGAGKANEEQRQKFEERMFTIMDRMMDKMRQGEPYEEEANKMQEEVRAIAIQAAWENLTALKLKPNEKLRRKFEEQMLKMSDGNPNEQQKHEAGEELSEIIVQMLWEELAPEELKANEELRHRFVELLKSKEWGANGEQKQKAKEVFRKALGDQMLKSVEAWDAQVRNAQEAREAQMRKTAEVQEATAREFMEAQQRVQRGVMFADQLSPNADAHYAGKGVSLGEADRPIFWYRPTDAKKYRVVYADLSVRDADAPANVPNAQPMSATASPKK